MRHTLVVATGNRGKLEELRALLADLPLDVVAARDVVGKPFEVVEDGRTFAENALKKARAAAEATFMMTLADDSGLEVDALGGQPGVRSARYAHDRATDAENNAALLSTLGSLSDPMVGTAHAFRARFRCALALIDPYRDAAPVLVEGVCEGEIVATARGTGGFGYDPLFVVAGTGRTLAELSTQEKNAASHRAKALESLRPHIADMLRERNLQIARISRP